MDKISILVPTRNRPQNIKRLVESAFSLAAAPESVDFWFRIDNDDHDQLSLCMIYDLWDIYNIGYYQGPRTILSDMTNELYPLCNGEIISHMGDDVEFMTPSWDSIIREEINKFDDKIALIYGKDGYNEATSTWMFFHRSCVDLIGYVVMPGMKGDYADRHNTEIFTSINRFVVSDVYIHHHHPVVTGLPPDRTNVEKNLACYSGPVPCQVQHELNKPERDAVVRRLKEYIDNFHSSNNKACATS